MYVGVEADRLMLLNFLNVKDLEGSLFAGWWGGLDLDLPAGLHYIWGLPKNQTKSYKQISTKRSSEIAVKQEQLKKIQKREWHVGEMYLYVACLHQFQPPPLLLAAVPSYAWLLASDLSAMMCGRVELSPGVGASGQLAILGHPLTSISKPVGSAQILTAGQLGYLVQYFSFDISTSGSRTNQTNIDQLVLMFLGYFFSFSKDIELKLWKKIKFTTEVSMRGASRTIQVSPRPASSHHNLIIKISCN